MDDFDFTDDLRDHQAKPDIRPPSLIPPPPLPVEHHPTTGSKSKEKASVSSKSSTSTLIDYLLSNNIITEDQLKVAQTEQREQHLTKEIGNILVDMGFLSEATLKDILEKASGVETLDIQNQDFFINNALLKKFPKEIATFYKILPIDLSDQNELKVATYDVNNIIAFDELKKIFGASVKITPFYAHEVAINEAIDRFYKFELSLSGILKEIEDMKDEKFDATKNDYVNPNVRFVNAVLTDAVKRSASDIHFEPDKDFIRIRYRIDGNLQQILTFHKRYWPSILVRLKIITDMNIAETRSSQDGRLTFNVLGRNVDFRVSSQPTVHGENIVARVLDKSKAIVNLEHLGMTPAHEKLLKKLLLRPEGIVIVTGPTGSGKTTTLYSILTYINTLDKNIMTLEDPVEYQLPIIRQSNVTKGTTLNFAEGIRSILRQDPDIIFIGEVRDKDTATMAMRAAMTGHQVYTTLHTNDAISSIQRLLDIGVTNNILAGSIICCIAQRLVRRMCMHCKEGHLATPDEKRILGVEAAKKLTIYKAVGCDKCFGTGYKGRIGIFEILPINDDLNSLIVRNCDPIEIFKVAKKTMNFSKLCDDGIQKVIDGITSLDELISEVDLTDRL